jgi:hypothetical protein
MRLHDGLQARGVGFFVEKNTPASVHLQVDISGADSTAAEVYTFCLAKVPRQLFTLADGSNILTIDNYRSIGNELGAGEYITVLKNLH